MNKVITVTSPLLPDLSSFEEDLRQIWESHWVTNGGRFHERLEQALCEYLKVPYISLFTNGTLPLLTALQALDVKGEVITTPYSFVATSHSIWWNGAAPVFVDIDPRTGNLDPDRIEEAITPRTTAIMPVHVYGHPCDSARIKEIADAHGLKVIYDAAHAFGVEKDGRSVLLDGDLSTLSFHATKVFNTLEGGAMVMHDAQMKKRIDYLKNFGFEDEVTIVGPGINSKMDEVRAAYGLRNLQQVDYAIASRRRVAQTYRSALGGLPGIHLFEDEPGVRTNCSYFPIVVEPEAYGATRDELYSRLRARGIWGRRYFYPLISSLEPYRHLPSASPANLPNAVALSEGVLCLPMHHLLSESDVERVVDAVKNR